MKIWQIANPKRTDMISDGYVSVHDSGLRTDRLLCIQDDEGHTIKLRNEQIGKLYKALKPELAG